MWCAAPRQPPTTLSVLYACSPRWIPSRALRVCAGLEQRKVTLLTGPVDKEWGMRVAAFVDPAGHSWEVAQALDS